MALFKLSYYDVLRCVRHCVCVGGGSRRGGGQGVKIIIIVVDIIHAHGYCI